MEINDRITVFQDCMKKKLLRMSLIFRVKHITTLIECESVSGMSWELNYREIGSCTSV